MALRLMTVMALRGATDAGNRVWDSRIGEVDALAREEGANPFILVYADDEDGNGAGASLRKPDRRALRWSSRLPSALSRNLRAAIS